MFYPFVDVVCQLAGYEPSVDGQTEQLPVVLAMFHTCFNVTNTAILIGLIPQLERLVCWLIPAKTEEKSGSEQSEAEEFHLQYLQANLIQTPEIAVLQAQKETVQFGRRVQQMFGLVRQLLEETDDKKFAEIFAEIGRQEDFTDRVEIEIARYLEQVGMGHLSDETKAKVRQMMRQISELESIGDACYNLARTLNRRLESGLVFEGGQLSQLRAIMVLCDEALTQMNVVMRGRREEHSIRDTFRIENDINSMRQRLKSDNIRAINNRDYDYALGTMFADVVNECEKLGDYVVNVVEARFGK